MHTSGGRIVTEPQELGGSGIGRLRENPWKVMCGQHEEAGGGDRERRHHKKEKAFIPFLLGLR